MGVLSGSSARVKSLIFRQTNDPRFAPYPNLNFTVYYERQLSPVRNKTELQRVSNCTTEFINLNSNILAHRIEESQM